MPEKKLGWIEKRKRHGPGNNYDVVSVYYVLAQGMDFVVFQAPTLPHIVTTRINNAIFYTKKAFEIIQEGSDILYSKPTSWKSTNSTSKEQNTRDFDNIFEAAQDQLNKTYDPNNSKKRIQDVAEEVRGQQAAVGESTQFSEVET